MRLSIFYFSLFILTLSACQEKNLSRINFQGKAQGTYYSIIYFDSQGRNLQQEIDSLLDAYDLSVSLYDSNSIICRINRNDSEVEVDDHFRANYEISRQVAIHTGGFFDFTIGQLVNAWGFGLKNRDQLTPHKIDSLLRICGFEKVRLEGNRLVKEDPRIWIDYNAVAQGYSVDVVGLFLESKGIDRYLIDIGGEVLAKGRKEGNKAWSVGIELPEDKPTSPQREIKAIVDLQDRALATSGNYRKFYVLDGIKYSHTIDPKLGSPVHHSLLSASVFASTAATADAYATAFMVMGLEKTIEFIKSNPDLGVYLIYSNEKGELKTYMSDNVKLQVSEQD